MPIIIPLLVAGAALFFLASKTTPGGIAPIWIVVLTEDGDRTSKVAQWRASDEQTKLFGPRQPDFYTYDEGGMFLFRKDVFSQLPASSPSIPITTGSFAFYKPDVKPRIVERNDLPEFNRSPLGG